MCPLIQIDKILLVIIKLIAGDNLFRLEDDNNYLTIENIANYFSSASITVLVLP